MTSSPVPTDADPTGLRLDPLRELLGRELVGFEASSPITATLLAGGRSNVTYRLAQGDVSWVLRRPPLGHVVPTAHDMAREYRVLSALHSVGFPAPRPLLLVEDESVIGARFLVMDYVPGRVIADAEDASEVTTEEADRLSSLLVRTLVRLHEVDVSDPVVAALGRPAGYLRRQVARWSEQWSRSRTCELADADALIAWLHEAVDRVPEAAPAVVHGDYRIDNLMLSPDLSDVRAVLDWEMCTLGDPLADLATTLVYWSRPEDRLRHDIPVAEGVTDVPGFWSREQVVEHYLGLTGADGAHLDIRLALACLKLAAITESIHRRTLEGAQLGAAAERGGMDVAAPALLAMGLGATTSGLAALSR